MKKIIKNSITIYIGMIVGIFVSILMINADSSLNASSINIDKTNMPNISGTILNSALDYLYERASHVGECPSGYTCEYDFGGMFVYETASKTYEHIVYMDPTDLSKTCYDLNSDSTTGTKTGCMKWYIYEETGDKYYAILDHNTTAKVSWNRATNVTDKGTNVAFGPNTTGDSTKDNLAYIELMKLVSDYNLVLVPDLISAEEVASIVGYDGFNASTSGFYLDGESAETWQTRTNYDQGTSKFAWLFDNTGYDSDLCISYGCNVTDTTNSPASWTKTVYGETGTSSHVWTIGRNGSVYHVVANTMYGLRPVIKVDKTLFQ